MKTSVIQSPRHIIITDASLPEIGEEEVLVRLEGTGVCASNLPVWEGREWFHYPFEPGAPGHEGYGRVVAAGERAEYFLPGDRVAMISYHTFAEFDKANMFDVVKLPSGIGNHPFPGEPAACAVNVFRRSDILRGRQTLVIGAGFLGCMLIQLLKNAGAEVIVVSRRNTSLEYAKLAGADHTVEFTEFYETVRRINSIAPGGVSRVIEATGIQSSIDLATEVICTRGKLIIAGYHQDGFRNVNMQSWNWKGIDVINAHERDSRIYVEGMKEAARLTEQNILQPHKFITHYIDFENINDAFNLLRERPETFLKAIVEY